ncbi:hypothetical protein CBS147323_4277 [Aspergillus niger]|nr:hypothetical protein CBS147323_4277 [Aspergillus niger]KAI3025267.1 hypothetical protein CBS147347_5713 [Aspergillus niger]
MVVEKLETPIPPSKLSEPFCTEGGDKWTYYGDFHLPFAKIAHLKLSLEVYDTVGGLRALLCCKGDKWDDGQDMANRPVRNIPASSTDANQEKPGDKPEEDCVLDNSGKETPPRNLWKEAYDGLPSKLQEYSTPNMALGGW